MKLTKTMREAIVERLLERTRAPGDAKLRNREHALALRLIRSRYGDDVFERCRSLPEGWFRVHKTIRFRHDVARRFTPCRAGYSDGYGVGRAGRVSRVPTRQMKHPYAITLSEYAPLPASMENEWESEFVDPFFDEIEDFARALRDHEDALESLRVQTVGVLATYSTVELLSKDWPEGYALLPAEMLESSTGSLGVPVVRIADLNARVEAIRKAA